MIRENHMKLIHHVGMPPQLFDLNNDPYETQDLSEDPEKSKTLNEMTENLNSPLGIKSISGCTKRQSEADPTSYTSPKLWSLG